jgi:hypothetical protein
MNVWTLNCGGGSVGAKLWGLTDAELREIQGSLTEFG